MDPQQFLQDKLGSLIKGGAIYATPGPAAVKMLTQLEGSTPRDGEWNPGPMFKVGNPFAGEPLIKKRDTRIFHDPELGGAYGPGVGE